MFEEINGVLINMVNIDKIEKAQYEDGEDTIYQIIYYNARSQGMIKENFESEKERNEKYDKFYIKKRGLLG